MKYKWEDIPKIYKGVVVIVAVTAFFITFHDQFVTESEAAEKSKQERKANNEQIIMLRVDNKEAEKRTLVRDKAKAIDAGKKAEADTLQQDIETLRSQIKGLCDQIDSC